MNAPHSPAPLPDIQNLSPDISLSVNNVGIRALRVRIHVPGQGAGLQDTVATCSLGVMLSPAKRGAHMSRFIEALHRWNAVLTEDSLHGLLEDLRLHLDSPRSMASFHFPFFARKTSPAGMEADMAYECGLKGELDEDGLTLTLFLEIPVMTVCPCSMAICEEGAHSQRALVRLRLNISTLPDFNKFISLAESSASSAVYTLLKRRDEKLVTEQAFANPCFVEDVARKAAFLLGNEKTVLAYDVEVESMESIHNHNAFASIQGHGPIKPL